MSHHSTPAKVPSPFGGDARLVQTLPTSYVVELYRRKCGANIEPFFRGNSSIFLYECVGTGYKFWRPLDVAGDESFYITLSAAWTNYYRTTRWEYSHARSAIPERGKVLEIGCGRGHFLRSLEGRNSALGIELNSEAIANRVTSFPIEPTTIDKIAARGETFDVVCAFQVLEHIHEPGAFLRSAIQCVAPRGKLILSTPNFDYQVFNDQLDAFDLPPHHMGHFTESSFERIAEVLGLGLSNLVRQPRPHSPEMVRFESQSHIAYKLARKCSGLLYRFAFRATAEPGPNLLAVFCKPGFEERSESAR